VAAEWLPMSLLPKWRAERVAFSSTRVLYVERKRAFDPVIYRQELAGDRRTPIGTTFDLPASICTRRSDQACSATRRSAK